MKRVGALVVVLALTFVLFRSGLDFDYVIPKRLARLAAMCVGGVGVAWSSIIFQTLTERDTIESTGVGLAIVKKIVERQGGRIGVKSAEGQGAKFVFTWPKQPPKAKNVASTMATTAVSAVVPLT